MSEPVWPSETERLFTAAGADLDRDGPLGSVEAVERLVADHDRWRQTTLNLLAADGIMSERARAVLASDLSSRVAEGLPGVRDTSTTPAVASRFSDTIESHLVALLQRIFRARYVEWRPVSTTMATAVAMRAICEPGDVVAVQSMSAGANISYHDPAVPGMLGLPTVEMPGTPLFEIDLDGAADVIRSRRPRCIVVGGTKVLFPYPLARLRELADEVGAILMFDAAHLGPFIHADRFNDPLREGAHVMVTGTHKIMGGPVGGVILTNEPELAAAMARGVWPSFLQTRDQNKLAAAAIAMAEMLEFGARFAADVQANAKRLGAGLERLGYEVIGGERGYSQTHQVLMRLGDGHAGEFALRCSRQSVLLAQTNVFGEVRSDVEAGGVRLAVAQITRLGMGGEAIDEIAELVHRAGRGEAVEADVARLAGAHPVPGYCW